MNIRMICLIGAVSFLAHSAHAACELPTLVREIPDGATATEQQLLAVQAEVESYVAAMDAYIACENESLTRATDSASADYLYWMTTRIESARSEVDAVAVRFNAAVQAFRDARPNTGRQFPGTQFPNSQFQINEPPTGAPAPDQAPGAQAPSGGLPGGPR